MCSVHGAELACEELPTDMQVTPNDKIAARLAPTAPNSEDMVELKWRRATLRPQPMVQPAKVAIFIWNSGIMRALLLGMDDEAVEDGISPQHTIYRYYHETPGYCRKCLLFEPV